MGSFVIVAWGVVPVLALLGQAIWRLTPLAVEPVANGEQPRALGLVCRVGAVQHVHGRLSRLPKGFSPRVVVRALHLARHPRPIHVALAPLFCMSLFHASKRGLAHAWGVLGMVVVLVTLVRALPQPWRGIIDGGVVIGLGWGAVAIIVHTLFALAGRVPRVPAGLPAVESWPTAPTGSSLLPGGFTEGIVPLRAARALELS